MGNFGSRISRQLVRTAVALVLAGVVILIVWRFLPLDVWVEQFARTVDGMGPWAKPIYAAVYAVALVLCAPGAPFSVGAGLVWGMAGWPVTWAGAVLGACGCFVVARYALARRVRPMVLARPMLVAMDQAVAEEGWRFVLLLRLNPLLPFNVQNYTCGVTRIGFWPYAIATAVGIVPNSLLHVYFGALGRDAMAGGGAGWLQFGVLALGIAMTVAASAIVGRKVRSVLARS